MPQNVEADKIPKDYSNVTRDLGRLAGFPDDYDGNLDNLTIPDYLKGPDRILDSSDEADRMKSYIQNWLGTQLGLTQEEADRQIEVVVTEEPEPVGMFSYAQEEYQYWGERPSAVEIRKAGRIVEVGGPTPGNAALRNKYEIEPDVVTNIKISESLIAESGRGVDFVADGSNLPLKDESVGTIFAAAIPDGRYSGYTPHNGIRESILSEANRVLKRGGRVIWHDGMPEDMAKLQEMGFEPEYVDTHITYNEQSMTGDVSRPMIAFNGCFVKK